MIDGLANRGKGKVFLSILLFTVLKKALWLKGKAWKRTHFTSQRALAWELTFWENQSGGRPGSAKGLIALLTDTLQNEKSLMTHQTGKNKEEKYHEFKVWSENLPLRSILEYVTMENDTRTWKFRGKESLLKFS